MQSYTPAVEQEIGTPTGLAQASGAKSSVGSSLARMIKQPAFIFLTLLLLSLPLRLSHLQEPISGEHQFRQSQTSLSVWEIREHGISWLHPKLGLFGPPWECPLEYPVFQLIAAGVDSIAPWHNLDASIRLTSVIFFYLSSIALYLLARQLFERPAIALFTSAIFIFSIYNLDWSQTLMIEYAADFFALAYILCLIRWTLEPRWLLFFLALLFGTLGALTKITTFAWPMFVGGILAGLHAWQVVRAKRGLHRESADTSGVPATTMRLSQILLLGCLLLLPLAIGYAYVRFSDQIKAQSPYTAWLSSDGLKKWNYGTLAQRLSRDSWLTILSRIPGTVRSTPVIILVVGLLAIPFRMRAFQTLRRGNFWIGLGLAVAPLVVILVFFNLYVIHSYYLIAVVPLLALSTGVGMDLVLGLVKRQYFKLLVLFAFSGLWLHDLSWQAAYMLSQQAPDERVVYLTQIGNMIPKDDPVIIVSQSEWSSYTPYYLKHRAFMALLAGLPVDTRPLLETDYFKQNGFHWLLIDGTMPVVRTTATSIMKRWKFARLVPGPNRAYALFSLSDQ